MTLCRIIKKKLFWNSVLFESERRVIFSHQRTLVQVSRSLETQETLDETPKKRKVVKVAILGRPNAGKSTLINCILNKTICDVSCKTHTTRRPLRAGLVVGDTQIVFVDTPGVVTKQEYRKFDLSYSFLEWKKRVFEEVDIVGIIHEAERVRETHNFSMKLIHCLHELPETTPLFLIINKIDLVKDKRQLIKASQQLLTDKKFEKSAKDSKTLNSEDSKDVKEHDLEENVVPENPSFRERISKIFYISALQNVGVGDVVSYLLEQAKEGEWTLPAHKHCDTSLRKLIINLIRAEFMNCLPHNMPYSLKFQIELLEENDLGQIICVVLAKCKKISEKAYLLSRKFDKVKKIARKIEADLYHIFQKDFKLTIVVTDKYGKA